MVLWLQPFRILVSCRSLLESFNTFSANADDGSSSDLQNLRTWASYCIQGSLKKSEKGQKIALRSSWASYCTQGSFKNIMKGATYSANNIAQIRSSWASYCTQGNFRDRKKKCYWNTWNYLFCNRKPFRSQINVVSSFLWIYIKLEVRGDLRAPTSSCKPFGPLHFVLCALWALRPCDPRVGDVILC